MNIKIIGAKEHNLKDITVNIPRNKLVVITGVSGSGKSSLAFDTIFAEAQREYLESLNTYARRTLPKIDPPNVDAIEGLTPCIMIDQRPLARNPRSTVGTVTEVYTFLRLLYSRLGKPVVLHSSEFSFNNPSGACQTCTGLGVELIPDLDLLIDFDKSLAEGAILHRKWKVDSRYWNIINAIGLFDMDKPLKNYSQEELDILVYSEPKQFQNKEPGFIQSFSFEGIATRLFKRQADSRGLSATSYDKQFLSQTTCRECGGSRLNARARSVTVNGRSLVDLVTMEIRDLLQYIDTIDNDIAASIVPFIKKKLKCLVDVGVGYLTLSRSVATLSNGESQKVKLARQLGSSLTELIYILDEPTAGLHPRDIAHLCQILKQLVAKANSVIVVEHDKSVILSGDHIIDMGPGAGIYGGRVVAQGTPEDIANSGSVTGKFLSGEAQIKIRRTRRPAKDYLEIQNARLNNLKNINVKIPKNILTCITGVAGAGKSSLVDVLLKRFPKTIVVDQSSVGTSPRSNPATYTKAFDAIRREFACETGQSASLFTFNGEGGCKTCDGLGYKVMDMHFLGEMHQVCEVCQGSRYNDEALKYRYKGKSVADVLGMTIVEAQTFFGSSEVEHKLELLAAVGLGYLQLGQPLNTLSGGEAQRVKLASRLSVRGNIYVLDEPTTGLHFLDIDHLLSVINKLVDSGNTVIIVEHNLDIIKNADWVIDLGPEGGKNGGEIVAEGTPELIVRSQESHTGIYLRDHI